MADLSRLPPPIDKLAKFDPEHGIIKYNNKVAFDRDVNAAAFENDTPWGRRPERANVGFSAFKARFRK